MANSPTNMDVADEFRRLIGDTSHSYVQVELQCSSPTATLALFEVTDGSLITTVTGDAGTSPLNIDLTDKTIEQLVIEINATPGYQARISGDGDGLHHASDLEIGPPRDFLRKWVQIRTRRYSDQELTDFLNEALVKLGRDFNTTYDIMTIPSKYKDLVFVLAQIAMYWNLVSNANKRRGTDLRVEDFRSLHQALLDQYERSLTTIRTQEVITKPTPEELDDLGAGDIIVGSQYRRNYRTGRMTPGYAVPLPAPETILATFIGGAKIQINWTRSHHPNFHHYELWRGTTDAVNNLSEVVRPLGSVPATGTKIHYQPTSEFTVWVDGGVTPLPPGTYYYRLYVYTRNGEYVASNVVAATVV